VHLGILNEAGRRFRKVAWILLLLSAFMVTYSGLFFIGVFPVPAARFIDLGPGGLLAAGILDLIGGITLFAATFTMILLGFISSKTDFKKFRPYLQVVAVGAVLGVVGDLVGGLYAIGAQIGLYTSIAGLYLARGRPPS